MMILPGMPGVMMPGGKFDMHLVTVHGANDRSNIDIPNEAQAGDLAILIDSVVNTSSIPGVTPSGWASLFDTQESSTTNLYERVCVSYKIIGPGDPGSSVEGIPENWGLVGKFMYIFRSSNSPSTASAISLDQAVKLTGFGEEYPEEQTKTGLNGVVNLIFGLWSAAGGGEIITAGTSPFIDTFDLNSLDDRGGASGTRSDNSQWCGYLISGSSDTAQTTFFFTESAGSYSNLHSYLISVE